MPVPHSFLRNLAMTIFFLLLFSLTSSRTEAAVVLSEVMFDPSGSEYYDEYVELFNTSETESVDLTGWAIGDDADSDKIVEADGGMALGPGQFGLILDPGYFENSDRYDPLPEAALILTIDDGSFGKGGWSNSTAEPVILKDAAGEEIARFVYSVGNAPGHSDEKILLDAGDGPENWADSRMDGGTPGRRNSADPSERDETIYDTRDVVINEVHFAPPAGESEWVELFNRSDRSVDLNGWTFSDEDSLSAKRMTIEPFVLAPGEYVVLAADSASFVQIFSDVLSRVLFLEKGWPALNNNGDAAVIRDATGKVIDRVLFGEDQLRERRVSLERIHPDLESDDPDNWAAHVTVAGGSPGAQNSVFVERLPTQASLDASPNPFDERTILSYRLPLTTAYAHLWIYNSYGQLVRKLLDADPTGSERALVWDGRDDDDARLPMGIYIVYLEALNASKGVLCREKKAVVLAR